MDNKIETVEDAKILWEKFNEKIAKRISSRNLPPTQIYLSKHIEKITHEAQAQLPSSLTQYSAARRLQGFFKKIVKKDTLIPVIYRTEASNDYNDIIPQTITITRSINLVKQGELLYALKEGTWTAPIFNDKTLPQLAMSLFDKGQITRQQIYTILQYYQTIKNYSLTLDKFLPLLKPDRTPPELTEAAEAILNQNRFFKQGDPQAQAAQKQKFALLIETLPKSEQFCYITDISRAMSNPSDILLRLPNTSEDTLLWNLSVITTITMFKPNPENINDKSKEINLSAGARDALGITIHGDNYTPVTLRAGGLNIPEIEHGVRAGVRYGTIHYPTLNPPKILHEHTKITDHSITQHDVYHTEIMSTIPKDMQACLLRCVDVIRNATRIQNSKETWTLTDAELTLYRTISLTPAILEQDFANAFGLLLCYGGGGKSDAGAGLLIPKDPSSTTHIFSASLGGTPFALQGQNCYDLEASHWNLTVCGACVILDMLKNESWWQGRGFDYKKIGDPFKTYIQHIQKIFPQIKDDLPHRQIAKIFLYLEFNTLSNQTQRSKKAIPKELQDQIIAYIFSRVDKMSAQQLTFSKQSKSVPQQVPRNTVLLNGCQGFGLDALKKIIPNSSTFIETMIKHVIQTELERVHQMLQPPLRQLTEVLKKQKQELRLAEEKLETIKQEALNATRAGGTTLASVYDFFMPKKTYASIIEEKNQVFIEASIEYEQLKGEYDTNKEALSRLNEEYWKCVHDITQLEDKQKDYVTVITKYITPSTTSQDPSATSQDQSKSDNSGPVI